MQRYLRLIVHLRFLIVLCSIAICISIFIFLKYFKSNIDTSSILFSSSKYAPYAYQIVPGSVSKEVQSTLAYFELKQIQRSGDIKEIKIRPKATAGKSYQWKTYTLKKGYRLYLAVMPDAEGEFNDTTNLDYLNYDIPVLVDNNGYITK